jgi:hypothetical protein
MKFAFESDPGGRLLCRLEDADGPHLISSAQAAPAQAELIAALEDLESFNSSECYWQDNACDYRWLFKRDGSRLRLAVLRLTGVCPGYQHVAWTEEDAAPLLAGLRSALTEIR